MTDDHIKKEIDRIANEELKPVHISLWINSPQVLASSTREAKQFLITPSGTCLVKQRDEIVFCSTDIDEGIRRYNAVRR